MAFDTPYGTETVENTPQKEPENVVKEAFDGEIPKVDGSERVRYESYDHGGLRIITDHPERPDNGFWRGILHSSQGFGLHVPQSLEVDAQKIRDKWYEVLEKAREAKKMDEMREKEEDIKNALEESDYDSFQDFILTIRDDIQSGEPENLDRAVNEMNTLLKNLINGISKHEVA